jgi:hypothetical protein
MYRCIKLTGRCSINYHIFEEREANLLIKKFSEVLKYKSHEIAYLGNSSRSRFRNVFRRNITSY